MNIVPIGDKIVVKRLESESTTAGGIVLPETAKEKSLEGRVLSVGGGRRMRDGSAQPLRLSEGDRVLFTSYAGTEVTVDDEPLLIMSEDDILAILQ